MNSRSIKLFVILLSLVGLVHCSDEEDRDFLVLPILVGADSANERIFVVDEQNNILNLIDSTTNAVVGFGDGDKEPLLNFETTQLLPDFSKDLVVYSPAAGVSRLLVLGFEESGGSDFYQIRVLDYEGEDFINAVNAPVSLPGGVSGIYSRLILESSADRLWLSEPQANRIHLLDLNSFASLPGSPVSVGALPQDLSWDPQSGRVAVSQAGETFVSLINTETLTVETLEVGFETQAVSLVPAEGGEVGLVALSLKQNRLVAYRLDLADLNNSELLLDLSTQDTDLITGTFNQVASGTLESGRPAAFITQDVSGDLFRLIFNEGLTEVSFENLSVGAVSGERIAFFPQALNMQTLYYTSRAVGVLNVIDPDVADPINALITQIP